jgi:hypothetical protein
LQRRFSQAKRTAVCYDQTATDIANKAVNRGHRRQLSKKQPRERARSRFGSVHEGILHRQRFAFQSLLWQMEEAFLTTRMSRTSEYHRHSTIKNKRKANPEERL